MKVVFLDIDGVLNSNLYDRQIRTATDGNIDESRLDLLKQLVEQTGAVIVLSSSWRKHWDMDPAGGDAIGRELNTVFRKHGLKIGGKTPCLASGERAEEIRTWLTEHKTEVESFVILDDAFGGWSELASHLVQTNYRIGRGLEGRHVQRAIDLLKGEG